MFNWDSTEGGNKVVRLDEPKELTDPLATRGGFVFSSADNMVINGLSNKFALSSGAVGMPTVPFHFEKGRPLIDRLKYPPITCRTGSRRSMIRPRWCVPSPH